MKRYFGILVFVSLSLMLCAQPIIDVRKSQDLSYQGNVVTNAAHETWVMLFLILPSLFPLAKIPYS